MQNHSTRTPPGDAATELEELANRVSRLTVCRRDPERFHVDRSEIVAEMRKLARRV